MHKICNKYANHMQIYANINMHIYARICKIEICNYMLYMYQYADICNQINMQKYAIKNMQKYAKNMQLICSAPWLCLLCENMQKYAKNMQLYARYANMIFICKICTPHFADAAVADVAAAGCSLHGIHAARAAPAGRRQAEPPGPSPQGWRERRHEAPPGRGFLRRRAHRSNSRKWNWKCRALSLITRSFAR